MANLKIPEFRVLIVVLVTIVSLTMRMIEIHNGHTTDQLLQQFTTAMIAICLAVLGHYAVFSQNKP